MNLIQRFKAPTTANIKRAQGALAGIGTALGGSAKAGMFPPHLTVHALSVAGFCGVAAAALQFTVAPEVKS